MGLPLCCILNGIQNDGHCCGFKLCEPCTDKYRQMKSKIYRNDRCNYIADLHAVFSPECDEIRARIPYRLK
jgi:hypothetical protein